MSCVITIVRHGETEANVSGIIQGQLEWDLNDLGKAQAAAVAKALANETFDVAYSSDLSRALSTAQAIAVYHPELEIHATASLREWNFGDWQGRPVATLANEMRMLRDEQQCVRPPNGESWRDFQERVSSFMNELAQKHAGQRVLVVTHGGALQRIFRMLFKPEAISRLPMSINASISRLEWCSAAPSGWRLLAWSETAHLAGIGHHGHVPPI